MTSSDPNDQKKKIDAARAAKAFAEGVLGMYDRDYDVIDAAGSSGLLDLHYTLMTMECTARQAIRMAEEDIASVEAGRRVRFRDAGDGDDR